MKTRSQIDAVIKPLAIFCMAACGVGAVAAVFVILVRVPTLSNSRLESLFGTLQGVAVGLLFAITALLINLTSMVRRVTHPLTDPEKG